MVSSTLDTIHSVIRRRDNWRIAILAKPGEIANALVHEGFRFAGLSDWYTDDHIVNSEEHEGYKKDRMAN